MPSPSAARPRARATASLVLLPALLLAACTGPGTPSASPSSSTGTATASPSATASATTASPTVAPPAPTEPAATVAPAPDATAPAPGATTVDVVVTFAGWSTLTSAIEVGGYAATVETGGTCELALTGPSGATATATAATNADATTTACELLSVPASSLRGGTWTGTLTYRSARSIGTATVSPIEVP